MRRPSKDRYYLNIAKTVGQRSTCLRRKFGAVIVVDDTIVSTGYNGPARGVANCEDVGCAKNLANIPSYKGYDVCPAVHAEENAVINAARSGTKVLGGILYIVGQSPDGKPVPSHPCDRCKRVLINAGIKKVITEDENGNIVVYNVNDWIEYDTKNYIELVEKLKSENS